MVNCPFFNCDTEFECTGGARTHLQVEHDVPCNRQNVWFKLDALGADVPEDYKFWEIKNLSGFEWHY